VFDAIKRYWRDNGTKVIGGFTAVTGALGAVDHETLKWIERSLGEHTAHLFACAILFGGGFAAFMRGFTNSKEK
jgi:hypothetical protein